MNFWKKEERVIKAEEGSGTMGGYQIVARKTMDADIDPRIISFYDPESPVSEQYRILRTNLFAIRAKKPLSTVAVTSSIHGEGKTITAVNLAICIASDRDKKRVLIVDGDLRRSNVTKYLGMDQKPGIAEILVEGRDPEECFKDAGIPCLSVLAAGAKVRNPAELLCSKDFKKLVELLRTRFDFIIFDAPPIIPVTDGGLIAAQCDGALIVVQAGRTQRGVVNHANGLLHQAGARVLGYVLTNIRYHIPAYIYRYL
jgi:capsular exopolysaccharide synthesis family protein